MFYIIIFAVVGFFAGVLINRAADNLPPPARRSLLEAPRCDYCGTSRGIVEQVRIVGFLAGDGKCPHCHAPLELRGPLTEIGSVLLFSFLGTRYGLTWTAAAFCLTSAVLLLITVVDLEHRLILNIVVLPSTVIGLLLSPLLLGKPFRASLISSLLGMVVGYAALFGIYLLGIVFVRLMARSRRHSINEVAFGLGDVKLAGLVGALLGVPAILYALVYAILLGGFVSFVVVLFQLLVKRRYAAFMAIPYGPFITIASWFVMVWGNGLVRTLSG